METKVVVKCISKKQSKAYYGNGLQTEIELQVPYDQKSIYYQMSGGTAIKLITVNQDAADMFQIDGDYGILISPEPKTE